MKRFIAFLCVATLFTGMFWSGSPRAAEQDKPGDVKVFMRAKLLHSKNVLEGLATENYELIAKDSQQLTLLSLDAGWRVLQTPEYERLSLGFRKSSQTLTDVARKKNLDGATLAFVDLTLKCVECHKYVRSVEMARLNDATNPLLPLDRDSAGIPPAVPSLDQVTTAPIDK